MLRVPRVGENEVVRADQPQPAVRQRLVDHDLGPRRIQLAVEDQREVHVVEAHRSPVGPGDATELQAVAGGLGERHPWPHPQGVLTPPTR